jgi:cation:H+ antiporter
MLIAWIVVFIVSLAVMIKGADWFLESSEKIGIAIGLSPFIIGVLIVGLGTSFPELISSVIAVFRDATEIVTANAIGSNITNILLVVGLSAVIGRKIVVGKSLIDLDLPLLAIGTVIFIGVAWDGSVNFFESLLLVITYSIYLLYTLTHKDDQPEEMTAALPSRKDRRNFILPEKITGPKPKIGGKEAFYLVIGIAGLVLGARYLVEAVINLSGILNIATGIIAITAVAIGTSLPELLVSVKAAMKKKSEIALGNIFGSNVFNLLIVVGVPGLFKTLNLDLPTLTIGLPTLALVTLIFIISGISRRIHIWEGAFYLSLYVLFLAKLFNLF